MKKLLAGLIFFALITLLLVACGGGPGGASASGSNTVHMNDTNFTQSSITIKKGENITLIDDTATVHIINNGIWMSNGTARSQREPGAPNVQAQFQGNDTQQIGPFNTPGTYHLYCTVHPNMNLTVNVR